MKFTDNSPEVLDALRGARDRALETCGLVAEGYAKRLTPVDTGRLRNSISHARDDESAYIGSNVEYAVYVELGTRKVPARPYLVPAVRDHQSQYKSIIQSELDDS